VLARFYSERSHINDIGACHVTNRRQFDTLESNVLSVIGPFDSRVSRIRFEKKSQTVSFDPRVTGYEGNEERSVYSVQ